MLRVLKVHANAETEFGAFAEEYQIDMEFDPKLVEFIMALVKSDKREYIGEHMVECNDYEYMPDGTLAWAGGRIGDLGLNIDNVEGKYMVRGYAWKQAEGDQHLDQLQFYRDCDNWLPGNFWIVPAAVLRALLQAAS